MGMPVDVVNNKLSKIFEETFPDAEVSDWGSATQDNLPFWDSFATLTLLTSVEHEFRIRVGLDKVTEIHSFSDLQAYVTSKLG